MNHVGLNLAIEHIGKQFAGSLKWNELPQQHIGLARWHRAGSICLNETTTRKMNKCDSAGRIYNMNWAGW